MENVLRLAYRIDLDMPRLIRKKTYKRITSNSDLHRDRIERIIKGVNSDDDSSVHLEFCFTGYYPRGEHFICATWPKYPSQVDFEFTHPNEYYKLFKGHAFRPKGNGPFQIEHCYSRRFDSRSQWYLFFRENPHMLHRPYLFTRYDEMFNRENQDDEKVLAYHTDRIIELWKERKDIVDKVMRDNFSIKNLMALEQLMRSFNPERVIMSYGDESFINMDE